MADGRNQAIQYRATLEKDKKYDGIFYFAAKNASVYCRPSCLLPRQIHGSYSFFDTVEDAIVHGYQACKRCHPGRLKNDLSSEILQDIDAGMINNKGVHGLADSLHISERHLRRIVQDRTGTSPHKLNKAMRVHTAEQLVTQTDLPIVDIAFRADFSSLRQFNTVFKEAFKISPREMRKATTILPLKLAYTALLMNSIAATLTHTKVLHEN